MTFLFKSRVQKPTKTQFALCQEEDGWINVFAENHKDIKLQIKDQLVNWANTEIFSVGKAVVIKLVISDIYQKEEDWKKFARRICSRLGHGFLPKYGLFHTALIIGL